MLSELIMHKMGWTDIWYAHAEYLMKSRWFVGLWTGEQNDLICIKRCNTNQEAEKYLSPAASSIFLAVLFSCLKAMYKRVIGQ
jgi:hypothetical protein